MPLGKRFATILGLILLGAGALYLIGNDRVALWDRDEPRYAQASRQMVQSGDWVVPRFLDQERREKPPLVYWCQAAVMEVMGDTGAAARFPSAVAVLGTALILALVARRFAGSARALWTVLIFCTSGLVIAAAKMCLTDAVMLFFVAVGQVCLGWMYWANRKSRRAAQSVAYRRENSLRGFEALRSTGHDSFERVESGGVTEQHVKSAPTLPSPGLPGEGENEGGFSHASKGNERAPAWAIGAFWISTALAGLDKGPQALGMHAVTLLVLLCLDVGDQYRSKRAWLDAMKWWRQLQPLIGVPILAIIVAPWLVAVHRRAPGFIDELFVKGVQHGMTSMEGHGAKPGYHLAMIFGTFFPWSLILPTTIALAWKNRRSPGVRFAIAAAVGPWLMMEFVTTKLPFYVLPAFPALAFLTSDALVRCARGQYNHLRRPGFLFAVRVWAYAALALGAVPWLSALAGSHLPIVGLVCLSAVAAVYATEVLLQFARGRIVPAVWIMGIGMAILIGILFGAILPNLEFLKLSQRVANDLKLHGGYGANQRVAMIGYKEPSLAFYQGGGAREEEYDDYFQRTPPAQWPRWIVISHADWDQVPPEIHEKLRIVAVENGVQYSDKQGKDTSVLVVENPKRL